MKSAVAQADVIQEESSEEPVLPPPRLIDWLVTVPFFVVFLLVLLVFDFLQKVAAPFGLRAIELMVKGLNISLVKSLSLLGTKVRYLNRPTLDPTKPYIIVMNHQSMFDIPIVHVCFNNNRPKFISKKELGRWIPGISVCLRREGSALIDRKDGKQALREIRKLGLRMNEQKCSAVLFPEGTRARDGKLKTFQGAGFAMLARTVPDAAIIPAAIDGSWVYNARKFGPIPFRPRVTLAVGQPIERNGQDETSLLEQVHEVIAGLLQEIREG